MLKFDVSARDPKVTRFTRVGGGVTTFARVVEYSVSLSRKPLSPGIEATPVYRLDLFRARSFIAQTMASYWFIFKMEVEVGELIYHQGVS